MALEPLSIRKMEKQTKDQYEAVVVISQRAKQILQNRMVERMLESTEETELTVFEEVPDKNPEDYEEKEKPTTQAVNEFLEGKLKWKKVESEEE
jgi:DNA-directed RNA polymerase subunit K/omega